MSRSSTLKYKIPSSLNLIFFCYFSTTEFYTGNVIIGKIGVLHSGVFVFRLNKICGRSFSDSACGFSGTGEHFSYFDVSVIFFSSPPPSTLPHIPSPCHPTPWNVLPFLPLGDRGPCKIHTGASRRCTDAILTI